MANKTVKETVKETIDDVQEKINFSKVVNRIKGGAKDINDFMLENSDGFVKEAVIMGEQWQNVASKAVKGGLKLASNNQDFVFDTLESLKGQLNEGRTRIKNLFSKN